MKMENYGFNEWILKTLEQKHIDTPTDIQAKSFLLSIKNESQVITSQTGSGKTFCYLLPILQNLQFDLNYVQAVIILPTKELARQVFSLINEFKQNQKQLKTMLLIGGSEFKIQKQKIVSMPPQIIVGTPSKVNEVIGMKNIANELSYLVLDEADMLFDLGFTNMIDHILNSIVNKKLIKFACSATLHESLSNKLKKHLKNAKVLSTSKSIWVNENLTHHLVYTNDNDDPLRTFAGLIKNIQPFFCIVFVNTKKEAENVYQYLLSNHFSVALMHKELSSRERKNIYKGIKSHEFTYLVATDLVSRGLDIEGADVVISYQMPKEDIWYIHRAGRAGRKNTKANVYTIYQPNDDFIINRIAKKGIVWEYLLLNKEDQLINKPLKLRLKKKIVFDHQTNKEIKKIINLNKDHVKPGYKKKIKEKIHKIKQKQKRAYLDKLIKKNIKRK